LLQCGLKKWDSLQFGKRYAGKKIIDILEKNSAEVETNNNGWGNFLAPARSVSVWVKK